MSRFSNAKRNKIIITFCIALSVILIVGSLIFLDAIFQYKTGVMTKITAKTQSQGEINLKINYFFPMGGYSVREVSENEREYIGDGMIDYDGSLGKHRIMINFGDIKPHDSFKKNMAEDGIFEIENSTVTLKAKLVFPSDKGFVLYIGSDTPIRVEDIKGEELKGLFGTISIPIGY